MRRIRRLAAIAALVLPSGCTSVSSEARDAVGEWRRGWEDYKRVTDARNDYVTAMERRGYPREVTVAAVDSRRKALDRHLDATEALLR